MKKRVMALCMALVVCFTTIGADMSVYASEQSIEEDSGEETEESEEEPEAEEPEEPEAETTEEPEAEEPEALETEEEPEEPEAEEPEEPEAETTEEPEAEETEEPEAKEINYAMVESEYIEIPGTQNVVMSIGDGQAELESVMLKYENLTTGEVREVEALNSVEDFYLFTMNFSKESDAGIYQLKEVSYQLNGQAFVSNLQELQMDIQFGVEVEAEAAPDEYIREEETVGADIVTTDEDGNVTSEASIEDVLDSSSLQAIGELDVLQANGDLVVMLDPGHDDTHAGAQYNGAGEEDLVLKIAQYCKEELETYMGVTVYMTRTGNACPNGGGSITAAQCNAARVAYASSVGANVYVSFHLNASSSSSANGVGVYYPNSNYNAAIGETGKGLATAIYNKLRALGLNQWSDGIIIRNSEDGTRYPDGSLADYLGVIRRCKEAGIPAVLIEHAFISGTSDYNNFLSSDEKLKSLGVADATAIAEYYGLSKKSSKPTISYTQSIKDGSLKVKWSSVDGAVSYQIYRSTTSDSGYKKIATTSSTKYTDTTVKVGTKYYYKVRAVQSDGSVSGFSGEVSGRALAKATITYVKSKSRKKIEIAWEKVTGASGYYVYRKNATTGSYEQVAKITSGSTLSYVDSVEKNNTEYSYKVQAYSTSFGTIGVGKNSSPKSGIALAKPTISNVVAKDQSTMLVEWSKVGGASGYTIKRSTSENGTYKKIATITSRSTLSYRDTTVSAGKVYYYKVEAYNNVDGGKGYSGASSAVSGKTIAKTKIKSVASQNETTLKVTWNKVSGAYGYRIKRSTGKNGDYTTITTVKSADTTSYKDTTVKKGKTYYYKIETIVKYNGTKGYSGNSSAVKGVTVAKTSINYVISKNSTALEVGWEKVSGASGYRIKRSTSSSGTYTTIATINDANTLSYKDKTVTTGKTYYYKVESINEVNKVKGYSGNSKAVSGATLGKVVLTYIKGTSSTSLKLKWKKVSGVTGYQIFRSESKDGTYKKIATVKGESTLSYKDEGLSAGKTYYYKIRAYHTKGSKTEIGTLTEKQKAWTLKKVTISKITTSNSEQVKIEWGKISNASGYTIYRKSSKDSSFSKLASVSSGDTLKYIDNTVKVGQIYYYRVCANSSIVGDAEGRGSYSDAWEVPVLAKNKIKSAEVLAGNQIKITWSKVDNAQGYQISYSTSKNGTYTSLKKTSATSYTHGNLESGKTYYYKVRSYVTLADGNKIYSAWSSVKAQTMGYEIMGSSDLTVSRMVAYYSARYSYPTAVYASRGASTAKDFFTILKSEAEAEGIKTEVLFAQVILETGGLQFGGDVRAEQCNFGGLGATGGGVKGETFPDVRTGLRAQTQHLKAYACTEALNQSCVDPRFIYVSRGTAPYVEWLSIPNNPYGRGWATDPNYGTKLLNIINSL